MRVRDGYLPNQAQTIPSLVSCVPIWPCVLCLGWIPEYHKMSRIVVVELAALSDGLKQVRYWTAKLID